MARSQIARARGRPRDARGPVIARRRAQRWLGSRAFGQAGFACCAFRVRPHTLAKNETNQFAGEPLTQFGPEDDCHEGHTCQKTVLIRNRRSSSVGDGQKFRVEGKARASAIRAPTPRIRHKRASRACSLRASARIEAVVRAGRRCWSQGGDERRRPPNRALLLSPNLKRRQTDASAHASPAVATRSRSSPALSQGTRTSHGASLSLLQNALARWSASAPSTPLDSPEDAWRCGGVGWR